MIKVVKAFGLGISSLALLSLSVVPSFASTITISGNGADSHNSVNVKDSSSMTVTQTNNADINNNVSVSNNTGGNTANKNTGGDVSIQTGNASSNVEISNTANKNVLNLGSSCGCMANNGFDIAIKGNGADSRNDVHVNNSNRVSFSQRNSAHVNNRVNVHNNTGKNVANKNTGGDVSIDTGDAGSSVNLDNMLNSNFLSF